MPPVTTPVFKKDQPDDSYKMKPLPTPTGMYPYQLSLEEVLPDINDEKMIFHMVGDTGSVRKSDFQKVVSGEMARQYNRKTDASTIPQFLYHLGDIAYDFGEAEQYENQFFEPYQHYPGPIFAIPGNHDSDVKPDRIGEYNSLDAFKAVFCDTTSRRIAFAGNQERKSNIQPNVYWTLKTPLANIIGLYGNVTKFGVITDVQRAWFIEELRTNGADRADKALILCIHHAPYSADTNHGSSIPMISFLQDAFEEAGVRPDIVFSGHVHNYQRFHKLYADGLEVPFIVAGAGGYDVLHTLASTDDDRFTTENPLFNGVELKKYCDDKHGFLQIVIERKGGNLSLLVEYYGIPHEEWIENINTATLEDSFTLQIPAPL